MTMTDIAMIVMLLGTAVAGFFLGRMGLAVVDDEVREPEAVKRLELVRGGYSITSPVTGRVVSACSCANWEAMKVESIYDETESLPGEPGRARQEESHHEENYREESYCEEFYAGMNKQENGVLIEPAVGKLYAPAAGKIIRLYPMGNAMVLRTDVGWELMIKIGQNNDEMNSMYYRSRVVKNEIVSKGKLLVEFDTEGLQKEGVDARVRIGIVNYREAEIAVCGRGAVKVGEELMRVKHLAYNSQTAPDSFIKSL